jgi:hypothetical protein
VQKKHKEKLPNLASEFMLPDVMIFAPPKVIMFCGLNIGWQLKEMIGMQYRE